MSTFMRWISTGIFFAILAGLVFLLATVSLVVCVVLFILVFLFFILGIGRGGRSRVVVFTARTGKSPAGEEAQSRLRSLTVFPSDTDETVAVSRADKASGQSGSQPGSQPGSQTDRQAGRQTDRQTGRQTGSLPGEGDVYDLSPDDYTVQVNDAPPAASKKEESPRN